MRINPNYKPGENTLWIEAPEKPETPTDRTAPDLMAVLNDVELRATQAAIASRIGRKKDRTEFLLGELERIRKAARAAINEAEGK